jgi:ATP-dependent helicase/DNAse subunit B
LHKEDFLLKSLINALKEVCTSHPFLEKRLIVDSFGTGKQVMQSFANHGNHAMNLKVMTLKDVAISMMDEYSHQDHELITHPIGSIVMNSILKALKEEKKLHYFNELEISPGLGSSIYNTIQLLRLSGFTSENLPIHHFSTTEKAVDYTCILHSFEAMLDEKGLWDDSLLFSKAIQVAEKNTSQEAIYIFQPNLSFLAVEEQFISVLMQAKTYILPIAPVFGVDIPSRYPYVRDGQGEPTALSYLYDEDVPNDGTYDLTVFASVTEESEINEVLRRIKEKETPFDTCAIYYSQNSPYSMITYQIAERVGLPVTFGEGLPITISRPGKLVAGMVSWLKSKCNVSLLIGLIREGIVDFGKESPSQSSIISMLKKTEIGWGQERFIPQIQKQIDLMKEKADAHEGEKQEYFQKLQSDYTWLKNWFVKRFKYLPAMNAPVLEQTSILKFFQYVLVHDSKIQSAWDDTAKSVLVEKIKSILPYATDSLSWYDAFIQIEDLLLNINIGASGPQPGAIHITSYKQGTFIDRSNLFFVGFDHHRFPGIKQEDPLLLDQERLLLQPNLPLQTEKAKDNIFTLLQVLAATNGHPTVSYCVFDQTQNRSNQPSYFFLKCFRYHTGEKAADFETINQQYKNLSLSSNHIDIKEWWQSNLNSNETTFPKTLLLKKYSHIAAGEKANDERGSYRFTEYDGNLQGVGNDLDPRLNKEMRISSGKLEKLAACPYKYFLEDVLKVSPPETMEYDPNSWIDAKTRGILLHEIYEAFYRAIQVKEESPSFDKHEDVMNDIANQRINALKELLLPPSPIIFAQESREILESCRIFLKSEEAYSEGIKPLHFEYSFGIGEEPPAVIETRNGESFHLSGKIDRVDQDLDANLAIIDYKTGRPNKFVLKKYFNGGRQLQHFLYAKAIESKLQMEEGKVKMSSYLFPTIKGTGERRERIQDQTTRETGMDIVERLLDVLKYGHFTMTDNKELDCKYCDFKYVCKRSSYSEEGYEGKAMNKNAEGVIRWKGVRAYE